jgi:hypothetical protein
MFHRSGPGAVAPADGSITGADAGADATAGAGAEPGRAEPGRAEPGLSGPPPALRAPDARIERDQHIAHGIQRLNVGV